MFFDYKTGTVCGTSYFDLFVCLWTIKLLYSMDIEVIYVGLDYELIGKRIAKRRRQLRMKQYEVEEKADIGYKYLTNIERAISIPSTEVIMRLAIALETTPDEFLVGTARLEKEEWRNVSELLRSMDEKQLALAQSLLTWILEQEL